MTRTSSLLAALCLLACSSASVSASGIDIGTEAPEFSATGVDGAALTLDSFSEADVLVIVFTCNECPVATAYEERFSEFASAYADRKVAFVAINNSRFEDLDAVKQRKAEHDLSYTYAYEGSGDSARAYGAQVTPHCFVFDKERKLAYKGAFDDNWNGDPESEYVSRVVDALLSGEESPFSETRPVGCAVKLRR